MLELLLIGLTLASDFDQAEYDEAARTILCDCGCHPQSAHECACGRAAEMRREIAGLIESGMTGEQVIARYVEQHGDQIRIAPTASGFNLVAWVGPFVGLLGAATLVSLILMRWRRAHPAPVGPELAAPAPSGEDQPYLDRLRRELEKLE